jgi:dihydrofolate reductase/thymidylate synthase
MKIPFSIVVAVDQNLGIGRNNALPWNLPGDLKHFKEVTTHAMSERPNLVIMGRKTWDSIPERFRPLPGRINCILTRDEHSLFPPGVWKAADFNQALNLVEGPLKNQTGDIFVIGGGEIFHAALSHPSCEKLHLTHIKASFDCDRFFPPLPSSFKETSRSEVIKEGNISYFFSTYARMDPS